MGYSWAPFSPVIVFITHISIALGSIPIMWTRLSPAATFDTDGTSSSLLPSNRILPLRYILTGFGLPIYDVGFDLQLRQIRLSWSTTCGSSLSTGYILPDMLVKTKPMMDTYIELNNNNKTNRLAVSGGEFGSVCLSVSLSVSGYYLMNSSLPSPCFFFVGRAVMLSLSKRRRLCSNPGTYPHYALPEILPPTLRLKDQPNVLYLYLAHYVLSFNRPFFILLDYYILVLN
jgi:hypothetical protein